MSEWLPRITASTPHQEILERPSALNPYPQRVVNGTFLVTESAKMLSYGNNMHLHVDYGDGQLIKAQMPTLRDVQPQDMSPPLQPDQAYEDRWHPAEEGSQLISVETALHAEAPRLAYRYSTKKEQPEIQRVLAQAATWDSFMNPLQHVRQTVLRHQEYMANQRPGVSLALARVAFANRLLVNGERIQLPESEYRKEALLGLVVPEIAALDRRAEQNLDDEAPLDAYFDACQALRGVEAYAAEVLEAHLAQSAAFMAAELEEEPTVAKKLHILADSKQSIVDYYMKGLRHKALTVPGRAHNAAEFQARVAPDDFPARLVCAVLESPQ